MHFTVLYANIYILYKSKFSEDISHNEFEHQFVVQDNDDHNNDHRLGATESGSTDAEAKKVIFNSTEYFSSVLNKEQQFKTIEKEIQKIKSLMQLKTQAENCVSQEQLNVVRKYLESAVSSMQAYNNYHISQANAMFDQTSNPPPNACNKKQLRFFSTKRKRNCTGRITKPSAEEQESACHSLKVTEVTVCAICWKEDDDRTSEWVSCSKCNLWSHIACLKPDVLESDEHFYGRCQ